MTKPMQLKYVKLTHTLYKFFYEDGVAYGEFYLDITPDKPNSVRGDAELSMKDPEYAKSLMDGLNQALVEYKK